MSDPCMPPKDKDPITTLGVKLGGEEFIKTVTAACHAIEDGRIGYAGLMALKGELHDIPVHQFSSGDTAKPANTPVIKAPDSKIKGK
jgi:hypothetical protein